MTEKTLQPVPVTESGSFEGAVASVKAGFPSPADDFRERLDLVKLLDPHNGCKAVCFIDGEYTVKRVEIRPEGATLLPCNERNTKYKPIPVGPDNDFLIWGVVTWIIKKA